MGISHPSRVRGLKLAVTVLSLVANTSHPSRVRGLKRHYPHIIRTANSSHPSRVRGLKQAQHRTHRLIHFAPITGAWIETLRLPNM